MNNCLSIINSCTVKKPLIIVEKRTDLGKNVRWRLNFARFGIILGVNNRLKNYHICVNIAINVHLTVNFR